VTAVREYAQGAGLALLVAALLVVFVLAGPVAGFAATVVVLLGAIVVLLVRLAGRTEDGTP